MKKQEAYLRRAVKMIVTILGFGIVLAGMSMNDFVVAHNNGKMPVKNYIGDEVNFAVLYQNLTDSTKYPYLADVLPYSFSLGDVLIFIGGIIFFRGVFME